MYPGYENIEDEELREFAEAANKESDIVFEGGVLHITNHKLFPNTVIHRNRKSKKGKESWIIKYDDTLSNQTVPVGSLKYPGSLL